MSDKVQDTPQTATECALYDLLEKLEARGPEPAFDIDSPNPPPKPDDLDFRLSSVYGRFTKRQHNWITWNAKCIGKCNAAYIEREYQKLIEGSP